MADFKSEGDVLNERQRKIATKTLALLIQARDLFRTAEPDGGFEGYPWCTYDAIDVSRDLRMTIFELETYLREHDGSH